LSRILGSRARSLCSGTNGGNCLEVGEGITSIVPVRDSKTPHGPAVLFPSGAWASFVAEVKDGTSAR
jgi:hypothetical protein